MVKKAGDPRVSIINVMTQSLFIVCAWLIWGGADLYGAQKTSIKESAKASSLKEAPPPQLAEKESTKLPLPRYASLRGKANMYVGPGKQYPIEWLYVRPKMPVEIVAEFDTWRQVKDFQGTTGWVHKSVLVGKRFAVVLEKIHKLFYSPSAESKVIAKLEPGVIARVCKCQSDWCQIEIKGYKGWIKRRFIWGIYPHETKVG